MTKYLISSCTKCATQFTAINAIPFMGQVAIWLQCENGHDVVEIVPSNRFANADFTLSKSQLWQMSDRELRDIRNGLGDFLDTVLEADAIRLNQRIGTEIERRSEYGF